MPRPWCCICVLVGLIASSSIGNASTISFSGNFIFDDDVQFFTYSSPTPGIVSVNTSSFMAGGFAPILALYDASGALLFTANGPFNNDCTVAGPDPATGYCYDASLSWDSLAGTLYFIALSQYDNFPIADIPIAQPATTWNNATTFNEFGNHFFTGSGPFGPGCGNPGFCLDTGQARTNNWAVTFNGPNGLFAAPVPEPGSIFLTLGGLAIVFGKFLRVRAGRV